MDYSLLKQLINVVEEFKGKNSSNKIEDFTIWLNNKLFASKPSDALSNHDELIIAFKILHLNKDLKKQTKGALLESAISTIDEYNLLLHLNYQSSFRKMEIVELLGLEAPTGIEIIKRLLKNNFIAEFADDEDKRAKRIKITDLGKAEIESIKPKIDVIFKSFSSPLSINESIQLNGILNKLMSA